MNVLQVVTDDSGRGQESHLVLGGCILTVEEWLSFTEQWKKIIDEPPAISYFKMREANALRGQFSGFTEHERDAKVWRLISTVLLHKPHGVRVVVDTSAYRQKFSGQLSRELDYPTFLASHEVIHAVMRAQQIGRLPADGPARFVFDEQGKESDMFLYMWSIVMPPPPSSKINMALMPSRPIIEDDKTFLPLQMADLFAWHYFADVVANRQNKEQTSPFWQALKTIPIIESELDEKRLSKLIDGLRRFAKEERILFPNDLPPKHQKALRKELAKRKAQGHKGRSPSEKQS
jgi:hypothetical protein